MDTDTKPKVKTRNIAQLSIALLLVIPAIAFWTVFGIVALAVVGVFAGDEKECNIARIPIQGILTTTGSGLEGILGLGMVTSADSIMVRLRDAQEDESIQAIILDINSPGGTPVAGDEILTAIETISKPTVAYIRDRGTSAAYWSAAGADYIVANPVSGVGSIGVTMSYLERASSTEQSGTRWIDLSSGEYKDAGNPERVLSETEQEHFQQQVNTVHEYMVDRIAQARENLDRERLAEIADGRAFLATEAISMGLIDEIGGIEANIEYIANSLGVSPETLVLCDSQPGGLGQLFQ